MWLIDLANFIVMLYASIWPLYLAHATRSDRPVIFYVSLLLGLAAFVHSIYHLSESFNLEFVASITQAISVLMLLAFGLVLAKVEL